MRHPELATGFKPLCVAPTPDGRFLLVSGSCNGVHMYTAGGVHVAKVSSKKSWVWSCAVRPVHSASSTDMVCGCEDGSISFESINMPATCSVYQVRSVCEGSKLRMQPLPAR